MNAEPVSPMQPLVPVLTAVLVAGGRSAGSRVLAAGLLAAACLTDVVAGRPARPWGQVGAFGVMVAPAAACTVVTGVHHLVRAVQGRSDAPAAC
jgi:phosphatidylglycerophosphate synthase